MIFVTIFVTFISVLYCSCTPDPQDAGDGGRGGLGVAGDHDHPHLGVLKHRDGVGHARPAREIGAPVRMRTN